MRINCWLLPRICRILPASPTQRASTCITPEWVITRVHAHYAASNACIAATVAQFMEQPAAVRKSLDRAARTVRRTRDPRLCVSNLINSDSGTSDDSEEVDALKPEQMITCGMKRHAVWARELAPNTVRRRTMSQYGFDDLPDEVMLRIFSMMENQHLNVASKVWRRWRSMLQMRAVDVWKTRFVSIGLLPYDDATIVGRMMKESCQVMIPLLERAEREPQNRNLLMKKVADLHRKIYAYWKHHLCEKCTPYSARDMCLSCTHASKFEWIQESQLLEVCPKLTAKSALAKSRWIFMFAHPAGHLVRFDDVLRFLVSEKDQEFANNVENKLRARNAVVR